MAKQLSEHRFAPSIRLTPLEVLGSNGVNLTISQLIAYTQNEGFTRLRLTGGKVLDVKETTDRIDFLIRRACGSQ